ncbi:E4 protein [Papillomaviridae sp. Haddock_c145]|nr:E4 protein [Papillomaviridae sp. Haddock_c145]
MVERIISLPIDQLTKKKRQLFRLTQLTRRQTQYREVVNNFYLKKDMDFHDF